MARLWSWLLQAQVIKYWLSTQLSFVKLTKMKLKEVIAFANTVSFDEENKFNLLSDGNRFVVT